jgi:hypothetical protein
VHMLEEFGYDAYPSMDQEKLRDHTINITEELTLERQLLVANATTTGKKSQQQRLAILPQ